jgi:hypothetical protein
MKARGKGGERAVGDESVRVKKQEAIKAGRSGDRPKADVRTRGKAAIRLRPHQDQAARGKARGIGETNIATVDWIARRLRRVGAPAGDHIRDQVRRTVVGGVVDDDRPGAAVAEKTQRGVQRQRRAAVIDDDGAKARAGDHASFPSSNRRASGDRALVKSSMNSR